MVPLENGHVLEKIKLPPCHEAHLAMLAALNKAGAPVKSLVAVFCPSLAEHNHIGVSIDRTIAQNLNINNVSDIKNRRMSFETYFR